MFGTKDVKKKYRKEKIYLKNAYIWIENDVGRYELKSKWCCGARVLGTFKSLPHLPFDLNSFQ